MHLPFSHVLAAGLDDRDHLLEIRIAATKNEKSEGHAVRIVHLLVGGLVMGPVDGLTDEPVDGPADDPSDG